MSKLRQKQRAAARRLAGGEIAGGWRGFLTSFPHLRKRVECAMPGQMLYIIARHIHDHASVNETEREFASTILPDLGAAVMEVFAGLPPQRVEECRSATAMACTFACGIDRAGHGITPPVLIIATLEWLRFVERSGFLVLAPGSAFDRARQVIEGELDAGKRSERFAEDYRQARAAALELIPAMQIRFEAVGLFVGALDSLLAEAA